MPSRSAAGRPARAKEEEELESTVVHELGNLLAGIRLAAHVLRGERADRERRRLALEVERLSTRAAALLANSRLLHQRETARRERLPAADLLESLRRAALPLVGDESRLSIARGGGLPDVRICPETVHHTLLGLVLGALEAVAPRGRVRVGARVEGRRLRVGIDDDGKPVAPAGSATPARASGRALDVRLADAVLRRAGGRARLARVDRGTCVVVSLPTAVSRRRAARAGAC